MQVQYLVPFSCDSQVYTLLNLCRSFVRHLVNLAQVLVHFPAFSDILFVGIYIHFTHRKLTPT